jgi:hypothetical protein
VVVIVVRQLALIHWFFTETSLVTVSLPGGSGNQTSGKIRPHSGLGSGLIGGGKSRYHDDDARPINQMVKEGLGFM